MNGDGLPDLVAAGNDERLRYYPNIGTASDPALGSFILVSGADGDFELPCIRPGGFTMRTGSSLISQRSSVIVRGMIRKAFLMSVNPGCETEYIRRHQPIWPELESVLLRHGVKNYSIFLHPETRQLFACVEFLNEAQWEAIAHTEVCRRWWAHMSSLMPSQADHRPIADDLIEVFHMESGTA